MSLRHRHYLKGKEAQDVLEELKAGIPSLEAIRFREHRIEVATLVTGEELYLVEGKPAFLGTKKGVLPTLLNSEIVESLPVITVDAGAVSHICNGSALMAPGIVKIDGNFSKDAIVVLKEVTYGKTIALVRVILDSEDMARTNKGRVAVNVHYVGDELWNAYKNIS